MASVKIPNAEKNSKVIEKHDVNLHNLEEHNIKEAMIDIKHHIVPKLIIKCFLSTLCFRFPVSFHRPFTDMPTSNNT
jgi:hypothetical protein